MRNFNIIQIIAALILLYLGMISLNADNADNAEKSEELKATIIGADGAEMMLTPAGEFLMGTPIPEEKGGEFDEYPQHQVYLDAFYMDKYEVTNAQYQKFIKATGHAAPAYWQDESFNQPNQPVVGVSWLDAEAYCRWAKKRLPTEAEWEKAARGTDGRKYPWGDEEPNAGGIWRANYDPGNPGGKSADGFDRAAPVGSFPSGASPYGVMDMAGNVWEWVADWYRGDYYKNSPKENPKGPANGVARARRGGSWDNGAYIIRTALRYRYLPDYGPDNVGFRCAQNATP